MKRPQKQKYRIFVNDKYGTFTMVKDVFTRDPRNELQLARARFGKSAVALPHTHKELFPRTKASSDLSIEAWKFLNENPALASLTSILDV